MVERKKKALKHPTLNIYGVMLGDVYILDYYGLIVYFKVSRVWEDKVGLVELATYIEDEDIYCFYPDRRLAKKTFFVNKNVNTKTDFIIEPDEDGTIPITITADTKIYQNAIERGIKNPLEAIYYIEKIDDTYTKWYSDYVNEKEIC